MPGRPSTDTGPAILRALELILAGMPIARAALQVGVSRATLQRAVRARQIEVPQGRPAADRPA